MYVRTDAESRDCCSKAATASVSELRQEDVELGLEIPRASSYLR